jgi:hypothetical protein
MLFHYADVRLSKLPSASMDARCFHQGREVLGDQFADGDQDLLARESRPQRTADQVLSSGSITSRQSSRRSSEIVMLVSSSNRLSFQRMPHGSEARFALSSGGLLLRGGNQSFALQLLAGSLAVAADGLRVFANAAF